ncbi:hypothetical protein ACWKW6_33410 [Dyadobacter jiangsuensis]
MKDQLQLGDLVESKSGQQWNVANIENEAVECFRYEEDWTREQVTIPLSELVLIETELDINIVETGTAKLKSGGPAWNVLEVNGDIVTCIMPEEFDFLEVEFPLRALEDFDNGFDEEIDRILGIK